MPENALFEVKILFCFRCMFHFCSVQPIDDSPKSTSYDIPDAFENFFQYAKNIRQKSRRQTQTSRTCGVCWLRACLSVNVIDVSLVAFPGVLEQQRKPENERQLCLIMLLK